MSDKETNIEEMKQETETTTKPYTLRRLTDEDMWPVLDIIGKVMPDDVTKLVASAVLDMTEGGTFDKDKLERAVSEVGGDIIMKLVVAVIKNMKLVKDEVYSLLADISGIPVDEIKKMPFGTSPKMIWDIVKNEANFDFFEAVSKSL